MEPILSPIEREALAIRNVAIQRVLRSDPTLTPEEALLMVVSPSRAVHEASIRAAREARDQAREAGCPHDGYELDEDGFCPMCGGVTLDGAVLVAV